MSQARRVRLVLLALALAAPAGCRKTPSEAPRFATRREHLLDFKPSALLAVDLDGDDRDDLLATDAERGEIRTWVGGLSGPGRPLLVGGWPLAPVALADKRSGHRLIGVASRAVPGLTVLDVLAENPVVRKAELPGVPRAIAAGEFGGSIVAVACDGGKLAVISSRGNRGVTLSIPDGLPRCALVRADSQGIVVGYQDRRSLALAVVDVEIPLPGIPRALVELDLDGDADLELVVAGGDGSIWVLGFGVPGPWDSRPVSILDWPVGSIPIDLAPLDLDGDGPPELVWLEHQGLSWKLGGHFERGGPSRRLRGYAGQTPCALAVLDVDRDGLLDLAVANRDAQSISMVPGIEGGGFVSPESIAVGRFPTAVRSGDLGADGDADLVVIESKDDTASVLISRGGKFERGAVLPTGPDPRGACLTDVDGDGRIDLVLVADDAKGSSVRCWVGVGQLVPQGIEGGPRVGHGVRALLAADFDGDRRAELVAADAELGQVILLPGPPLEVGDGPCALAAIRIDGDEVPEIAVALEGPGPRTGVALLDVEGGRLRETGRIETGGPVIALDATDFDGDGREDLALLVLAAQGSQDGEARAYLRRGDGFELAGTVPVSAHPRSIAAGDLDGDGLADVVVAAQYAHRVDLAFARPAADGRPWRLERQDALGAGVGCMDAILVDIDRDNDLDVVVANGHSDDVSVIRVSRR